MADIQIRNNETLEIAKQIIKGESMIQMEMNLKLSDTLGKPIMRSVFKGDTGAVGFSVVQTIINRFVMSFGFSTPPTPAIIEMITMDTLENFAYETLEDIVLFFKMSRTGKFGAAKKGLDSNMIFGEWFPKYLELKSEARENQYIKKKGESTGPNITLQDVKKTYLKIESRKRHSKIISYIDNLTSAFNRKMLEECIVIWSKDPEKRKYLNYLKSKRRIIKE